MFSQGIWLISEASKEYGFDINISEVLRIWKGGCIIRAKMLDFFIEILADNKDNPNLLNSEKALTYLMEKVVSVKFVTGIAKDYFIPAFSFNSSLDYFFSMVEENLPANLIQAQRDFWCTHLYEPTIANSFLLVFIKSIADFGNPTAIGGGFNTLAVQVYQQAIGNYNMAEQQPFP